MKKTKVRFLFYNKHENEFMAREMQILPLKTIKLVWNVLFLFQNIDEESELWLQ